MKISFNDIKDNITDMASSVIIRVKRFIRIAGLKSDERMISRDIKKEYRWLGEKYYRSVKDTNSAPDITKNIENIDYLNSQLMSVKGLLNEEQGQKVCDICSAKCDKSSVYCPKCGNKF